MACFLSMKWVLGVICEGSGFLLNNLFMYISSPLVGIISEYCLIAGLPGHIFHELYVGSAYQYCSCISHICCGLSYLLISIFIYHVFSYLLCEVWPYTVCIVQLINMYICFLIISALIIHVPFPREHAYK